MIEDDLSLRCPLIKGDTAGGFHNLQAMLSGRAQKIDELPIAAKMLNKLPLDLLHTRGEIPILERRTVAQSARLSPQGVQVMPRIIDRLVPTKLPLMVSDQFTVADYPDTIGSNSDGGNFACKPAIDAVMIPVIMNQAGAGDTALILYIARKARANHDQRFFLLLKYLFDCPTCRRRVRSAFAQFLTAVDQPAIELLQVGETRLWHKEPLAHILDLFLYLTLLPARTGSAGHRLDQVMAAHLLEPLVELPFLAAQHVIHGRGHIVVNAPPAHTAKIGKRPGVRIKHHLHALAEIGNDIELAAMAKAKMCNLHRLHRAAQNYLLMAPVELVGIHQEGTPGEYKPRSLQCDDRPATSSRSGERCHNRQHSLRPLKSHTGRWLAVDASSGAFDSPPEGRPNAPGKDPAWAALVSHGCSCVLWRRYV